MSKKKKRVIAKRRTQAKAKKQNKSKTISRRSTSNIQYLERPAISEVEAPTGFRAVTTSHGMLEYAEPLMDFVDKDIVKNPNDALQLALPLWNIDNTSDQGSFQIIKKDIIKLIKRALKLSSQESVEFFNMMIQRKENLFPQEIQPDDPMIMFIRKQEHCLITEFNYTSLNISDKIYVPTNKDNELVQLLNQMDDYIDEYTEYDEYEDHYFKLLPKCNERYGNWLEFKEIKKYRKDFTYNVEIYLNFIYCYIHEDVINLKTVTPIYIEEFFLDYVLRKVMVEPHEYRLWPPALKLFYGFLQEIKYFEKPEKIIKLLNEVEPVFIKILQARYS